MAISESNNELQFSRVPKSLIYEVPLTETRPVPHAPCHTQPSQRHRESSAEFHCDQALPLALFKTRPQSVRITGFSFLPGARGHGAKNTRTDPKMRRVTRILQTDRRTDRARKEKGEAQHRSEGRGVRKKNGEEFIKMA